MMSKNIFYFTNYGIVKQLLLHAICTIVDLNAPNLFQYQNKTSLLKFFVKLLLLPDYSYSSRIKSQVVSYNQWYLYNICRYV